MTFTSKIVVAHLKCVGDKCAYNNVILSSQYKMEII